MEEVINRLLEGNFDYENGSLDFSCSKLELTIKKGECAEGSFRILTGGGRYTQGSVISSDGRMECLTQEFVGNDEEIAFCFHGENLEEGDVVKGEFYVISNQGEYYLPFVVTVEYTVLTSSLGNIRNLFHFANLAKTSPDEATALFYSEDFEKVFNGSDSQYYEYYRGLSAYPGNEQNVEEFLIGINKKQRIEYLIDTEELRLEDPEGIVQTGFTVTRNGWGYTRLKLQSEGDFLYTEREELTGQDFVGNTCRVVVYVDSSLLHDGNNFGTVRMTGNYGEIRIPVTVKYNGVGKLGRRSLERKRQTLQLMEFYQAFRMKKISVSTWLRESGKLVERMNALDEKDISARLFQAQLLITEERFNEAQWILDHAADILDGADEQNPVMESYYLYLTTLIHREESYVNQVTEQVEAFYKRNRNEWRLAWLLLYLSEEYNRSFTKKWMFLEEQFERGCTSPILYIEAVLLVNLNPSLLIKLDAFEKQTLWYGARNEMLGSEVVMQFLYLAAKEREYSKCLYRILEACYRTRPDVPILREICSQLIKGGKVGKQYFKWYKRGVEEELRITRLYEHYMMSVDVNRTEALPRIVLMYFTYQNNLSDDLAAFLYANVYRNRESFPELYENYRNRIEQFVVEQILKKRISRDLAFLYKNLLAPRMLTPQVADALTEIMFMHLVQTPRTDMRYVVVYEPGFKEPGYYSVTEGKALAPLPGTEGRILFEDGFHNRYMSSVPYTTEKLMLPGKLVKLAAPLAGDARGLNLYLCATGRELAEVTPENEIRFGYLLEDEQVSTKMKQEIGMKLMHYYYEHDKIRELDEYLDRVEPEILSPKERSEGMRYLVLRGKEEKAYGWLVRFGPYGIEPKILVRLCSRLIAENEFVEDGVLTEAVAYAFHHGKYDENCLRYLALYLRGMTKELRDVWKAAEDFSVDTYELCEKLLIQMLFSGSFVGEKMQIFLSYVAGGAKPEVEEAFLSQCSYDFFVKDRLTESCVFKEIAAMYRRGDDLHRVCKLALIKYYAENKTEITDDVRELLKEFIHEMLANHIRLKMFTEFTDLHDDSLNQLADRTIVEYKAHPNARAIMHYCVEYDEGEESEYLTEEMQEVYGGVCFKDFVLFFGERLQYYIMEEQDGSEQLTESATIQKSDAGNLNADGKFNLVNDISISSTLQDYETVDRLLEEYEYREFMRNGLFGLR